MTITIAATNVESLLCEGHHAKPIIYITYLSSQNPKRG